MAREMTRTPVLAAGGIVLRSAETPLIAVVRLRKRNEWVLPKGKLDDGETAREAARREVVEETGHEVTVHEFLGTLVYESGGRSKVVHYWRMETNGEQRYELMGDVKAVRSRSRRPCLRQHRMDAPSSQALWVRHWYVQRSSALRRNLRKPVPRRRQPIPNPATATGQQRGEAGAETWCR